MPRRALQLDQTGRGGCGHRPNPRTAKTFVFVLVQRTHLHLHPQALRQVVASPKTPLAKGKILKSFSYELNNLLDCFQTDDYATTRKLLCNPSPPAVPLPHSTTQDLALQSSESSEHECNDCGKRYSTSSNLARHRQTHRSPGDKKARRCPHCDKLYVSMPAFSMHVRTHNQGCKCQYCGKCFSRPWLLQGHIRTHTGRNTFLGRSRQF